MARRSRRSSRVQTAEKTFVFNLNPGNAPSLAIQDAYIDIAQVHSLVNRVSARQGYEYVVQSLEIGVQGGGAFEACIMRLPEHWPCVNAWEKTMALWKQQQDDAADEAGLESTTARYRDFKIHFDAAHAVAGFAANLIPAGYSINLGADDEYSWDMSEVVVPNHVVPGTTVEYSLHMVGDDDTTPNPDTKGMIKAYAESRARPQQTDPNIVDVALGGLFGEMFDVGHDDLEVIGNLQDHNETPPYLLGIDSAEEYYPGGANQGWGFGTQLDGQFVDILAVNASQNYNTDTCPGFVAPCGLIKITYNAAGVSLAGPSEAGGMPFGMWAKLTLAPGNYKGVLAQSMQEAN